jgi:mRNA-degrading endonuclease toxin of MazEF toxin-antitoxin module
VWAQFPLSDKLDKLKMRPVMIVSNKESNRLDNDLMVCPITSRLRADIFSLLLLDSMITIPMNIASELRCNKIMTLRHNLITEKAGNLHERFHKILLEKIFMAFK